MPLYGDIPGPTGNGVGATGQPPTALYAGDQINLFNGETITAPAASIAVGCPKNPGGGYAPMVFDIEFASAPTALVLVQGATQDVASAYQQLYSSTNKQQDNYVDYADFLFYRISLSSQSAGGKITVTARR